MLEINKNLKKLKKGVGITIKSKVTSSKLATYLADHTNTVGRYNHACINEARSLGNLQDLIHTLAGTITSSTNQPK